MRSVPAVAFLSYGILASVPGHAEPRLALEAFAGARRDAGRVGAAVWYSVWRPGNRWDFGAGIRLSAHFGTAAEYAAQEPMEGSEPSRLFIDPSAYALNLAVFGELRVARRVALGANLDLIGTAGGPSRTVEASEAKPESFSYFAFGTKDHGLLDSAFFVAVRLSERVRLHAGLSHYVTTYTVTDQTFPPTRYQRFETVPFVAVGWSLGR